jgi:ubiquitin-conjugating enzyme E2 Q
MQQVQATTPLSELGWYMDFDAISNMFQWIVELHSFDTSLPLASDMRDANVSSIITEVRFGKDWPMTPPFIRIIRPRFLPFINGGGGHVTAGGAMCMELLTNTGWSPANSMESVILQVRMALCAVDDRPARLDRTPRGWKLTDYGIDEAVDAYLRAAQAHGWAVPSDFRDTAYGGKMP